MRPFYFLIVFFLLANLPTTYAQNYLRVSDPDAWSVPITSTPDWHEYRSHGQFDEITIVTEPQGIFTELELYATISQGPDANSWGGDFEIVWQFDLPANSIVHDSWLWVGPDIIKADMVDYWTALQTYEDIVDRNQDPSFFYRLPDNRYEIRIYPLFDGETRRIKMSFLIPTQWGVETVKSNLLHSLLQSTDYTPPSVGIGMLVDEQWEAPEIRIDDVTTSMTDTVVNGAGALMHYIEVPEDQFVFAEEMELLTASPLSDENFFVSTFMDGGERFYQLAFAPDWAEITAEEPTNSLILLDYNELKTSFTKASVRNFLQDQFTNHFMPSDKINVGVMTSSGMHLLSDTWWDYDADVFGDTLYSMLAMQDTIDLGQLLIEGFAWAQNQSDIDQIYLMAANDEFIYPPYADEMFLMIETLVPDTIPLTILDYQNENVSIIYYGNEAYEGNEYFYQLFENVNVDLSFEVYRNSSLMFDEWLQQLFPTLEAPTGILDFTTSLENGITYQRYSINSHQVNAENKGLIVQTGKYLGTFPLHVNANFITDNGAFYNASVSMDEQDVWPGDTLMREMWYGPYLNELEILAGSDEDRLAIIEQSIQERVLTGLTAFLALDPLEGGEPCIDCLLNSGEIILISASDVFVFSEANLNASPNPATDWTIIRLDYKDVLNANEWTAGIYDLSGRLVQSLGGALEEDNTGIEWKWEIDSKVSAGIYFCKAQSTHGELTSKIIVLPR